MQELILQIKNVVCGRCKITLQNILLRLEIPYTKISLGEVVLPEPLSPEALYKLEEELTKVGFSLLQDKNERIVNKVKSIVIELVYREKDFGFKNLSDILKEEIPLDYSHISSVFSITEGKTIQEFQNDVQMERIKELLEYGEKTISEIADEMEYSSAAYLSARFKKYMGISPSTYKRQYQKDRKPLDLL